MRARNWIVLLALGACLAVAGCEPPAEQIPITTASEDAREFYLDGRTAFEQFQPEKARDLFMKALAQDPEFALAHLGLAQISDDSMERREWAAAAADKARAASRGERLLIRSFRAIDRQDLKTAFLEVKQLVKRYPREARAHLMLGDAYFAARNKRSAIQSYNEAIALEPELAAAYRNLGRAFLSFALHKEARVALAKHLELLPDLPASHELLAVALMKGGDFDDSIARYKEVQRLDPANQTAWIGIGYNLFFKGDVDRALAHFQQTFETATDLPVRLQALQHIAAIYIDGGKLPQAIEQLEQAYALASEQPAIAYRIKRSLGDLYLSEGRLDEASRELEQALEEFRRIGLRGPRGLAGRVYYLYDQSRLAIARGELEEGRANAMKFRRSIGSSRIPNVKDLWGELQTRLALLNEDGATAQAQVARVSDVDPRLIFLAAQAQEAAGRLNEARTAYAQVADFNQPAFELSFVRQKAKRRLAELSGKQSG